MNLLRNRPPRGVIIGASAFIVILVICYFVVDLPLARAVHPYRDTTLYDWAKYLTDFGDAQWWLGPALVIALVCLPFRRDISSKAMYVFCSICAAGIFNYLLKMFWGRARPSRYWAEDIYGFHFFETNGSYFSFPSGHTVVFFAGFASLGVLFPRVRIPLLVVAGCFSFTRVLVEMHYLSDVIAGAVEGTLIAYLLASWWHRPKKPTVALEQTELEAETESA
jgi:membrane-associated phospholipid phosphatase